MLIGLYWQHTIGNLRDLGRADTGVYIIPPIKPHLHLHQARQVYQYREEMYHSQGPSSNDAIDIVSAY
jgi:hypothetical protein